VSCMKRGKMEALKKAFEEKKKVDDGVVRIKF
jgi:hypothetical protein